MATVHRELILFSVRSKVTNMSHMCFKPIRLHLSNKSSGYMNVWLMHWTWTQSLWDWTSQQGWMEEEWVNLSFSHILPCLFPQPLIPAWFLQQHNMHTQKISIIYVWNKWVCPELDLSAVWYYVNAAAMETFKSSIEWIDPHLHRPCT